MPREPFIAFQQDNIAADAALPVAVVEQDGRDPLDLVRAFAVIRDGPPGLPEHMGDHLDGGGFPVAPGDGRDVFRQSDPAEDPRIQPERDPAGQAAPLPDQPADARKKLAEQK